MKDTLKKHQNLLICLLLAAVTFGVYVQVGWHQFINFDDNLYITENHTVQNGLTWTGIRWAFTTGHSANWHPLTWLSHMLDCELFGLNPGGHHLVNVLLHIANTLLLFMVLRTMTTAVWQSAFVAALFALHPLHVESVAWAAERKDVLSALFWMLTMFAYAKYVKKISKWWYAIALMFFVLGLMSKPMLVTLPFVLLLLDYWPLERINSFRNWKNFGWLIIEKIPFFVLSAISSVITFLVQQKGGAMTPFDKLNLSARLNNAVISYGKYIIKTFLPNDLALIYPLYYKEIYIRQAIIIAIVLIAVSILINHLSKGRRYLLVGWLWYIGTLVPVIGLVQVGGQALADRYAYIPLIGLFFAVAWGLNDLSKDWPYKKFILSTTGTIIITACAIGTFFQLRYWQNGISLFQHAIDVTKNNPLYTNLGVAYQKAGLYDKAVETLEEAIKLKLDRADAYLNLGSVYIDLNKYDEAIEAYKQSVKTDPNSAESYLGLGVVYGKLGKYQEEIETYKKAIKIKPKYAEAYSNMSVVYTILRQYPEALEACKKAIEINPFSPDAHKNLVIIYLLTGDKEAALKQYEVLKKIKPEFAQQLKDVINKYTNQPVKPNE